MRVNFGCGNAPLPGYKNMDKEQCDLEKLPLPFKSKSVEKIYCSHVLEHLDVNLLNLMQEFERILKDEGVIYIRVPHFSWHNAYDELHRRFFNYNSFGTLHDNSIERGYYSRFTRSVKIKFFKKYFFWNYLVEPLVNIHSMTALLWESTFLCRLFPANELHFVLRKKAA